MGGGGHKFKLSDLMPNSWFLKLKNIKKPTIMTQNLSKNPSPPPSSSSTTVLTSSNTFPSSSSSSTTSSSSSSLPAISLTHGRTAHYFKRDLIISSIQNSTSNTHIIKSPRKSTRRNRASSNSRVLLSSPRRRSVHGRTGCACQETNYPLDSTSTSTDRSVKINISKAPTSKDSSFIEIPPIVTKKVPKKLNDTRARITPVKRVSVSSPRVRLRTHSPRMMTRRNDINNPPRWRGRGRSLAVVKSSMNPQKDFKESMVEMILENDIKGGKDLEDLLACYLELNSDGYHQLIIKVFKQIWFDLNLNKM